MGKEKVKIRGKNSKYGIKMSILVRNEGNMREKKVGPQKFTNLKKNNKEVGYKKEKDKKGMSCHCNGAVK